jgi:tetratricopeptide (TPR) repeat protein
VVVKNQPIDQFKPVGLTTLEWAGLGMILVSTWWLATKPLAWWQADKDYALSKALFTTNTYQTGLIKLESAIKLSPNEALFWDELANQYSRLVVGLQASPNASESSEMIAQLAQAAIAASDQALALNSKHLDFYKTRARVFINLSQLDPKYLAAASATLTTAQALAPTDPKLPHHLGLVQLAAGATPSALVNLETAVTLKPDYLSAWFDFGKAYELANQLPQAKSVYEHILTSLSPNNPEVLAKLKAINLLHPAQ